MGIERLGSIRVLLALEEEAEKEYAHVPKEQWATDLPPQQAARLWFYEDIQNHLVAAYDKRPSTAFEARRSDLSTGFAALRALRAGDLADMGWSPHEKLPYCFQQRRQQYHWLRTAIRAYEELCREQATVMRKLANAITRPLPAPRPRPVEPKPPYAGVHPSHLEARLLDLANVRCSSVVVGENAIAASWATPLSDAQVAKLQNELDFILAPAKVTTISPFGVALSWTTEG